MKVTRHGFFSVCLFVLAVIAFVAPAQAEILSLFCNWPQHSCCDLYYDVDLTTGRVTWRSARPGSDMIGPAMAQITDYKIT